VRCFLEERAELPNVKREMGLGLTLALFLLGCSSFPVADVRHPHATVLLISSARVVDAEDADDPRDYGAKRTGFSHIAGGDRAVLVALDTDSRPGWTDSGTGEDLIVELQSLRDGSRSTVGQGSRVWLWRTNAWGIYVVQDLRGSIAVGNRGASSWTIDVDLTGTLREEQLRGVVVLRHTFSATEVSFDEFKRRFPPATGWTR
jgi:hypothetical protein